MTDDLAMEIMDNIRQQSPRPQLHLLMLGDNNLRHLEDDPRMVSRRLLDVVTMAKDVPGAVVMVSTLMPSIENGDANHQIFLDFDSALKQHRTEILDPRFEVLDLGKSLRNKQGAPKEHLFEDQVHLNQTGAYVVAERIFDKVVHIPHRFFQ